MAVQADIKKFLPKYWLENGAPFLNGIVAAINNGSGNLETLVQACIDQLFLSTATGRYLIQLGEQEGFTMPPNSGLDVRAYKTLVPIMVSNPKQVRGTINELIQGFYTSDKTKPNITSSVLGPYSLNDGDDLIIETESGRTSISIVNGQVSNLNSVSAGEISAVMNSLQSSFLASTVTDRSTGQDAVKITSNASGAGAYVRIAGGKLQNVLKFPDLIATQAQTGTNWNIEKDSTFTDVVKFTWDGTGVNPNVFLAKAGDVVSIRGLVDGAAPASLLNGSYDLVDVGYDYFIIRNIGFNTLSYLLTQNLDNNIVFTSSAKITLYDKDEYALSTETSYNTATITVPAIPPLTRRFLSGSAHLHGSESNVLDFTRTSVKLEIPTGVDRPSNQTLFTFRNNKNFYNFKKLYYKTIDSDNSLSDPTYIMESNDEEYSVLPYTTPFPLQENAFYATIDSDEVRVDFGFRHGLDRKWQFTADGADGAGNISAGDLNQPHNVVSVVDNSTVTIRLKDGTGQPILFNGIAFGPADVFQQPAPTSDGSDFYLEFGDVSSAVDSGLVPGMLFKFDPLSGTDFNLFYSSLLKFRKLVVTSQNGSKINFSAGLGFGPVGLVTSGITGRRSAAIGGSNITYFFDKASDYNQANVMAGMKALVVGYTPSANPAYIGSYLYDPQGLGPNITVSKYVVGLTTNILKGANIQAIFVDSAVVNGENFPQIGELILDYGNDQFEGPIRYFAVVANSSTNQILIDPAYKFKKSHSVGANVQYIHKKQSFTPDLLGAAFPVYLTGTASARNTMFDLAELLVAAGIFIERNVILPQLRYDDIAIPPFD